VRRAGAAGHGRRRREWDSTKQAHDYGRQLDAFSRQHREQREAMAAEARMDPAQRAVAVRERMAREAEGKLRDSEYSLFLLYFLVLSRTCLWRIPSPTHLFSSSNSSVLGRD
jgi:hypothetical protein